MADQEQKDSPKFFLELNHEEIVVLEKLLWGARPRDSKPNLKEIMLEAQELDFSMKRLTDEGAVRLYDKIQQLHEKMHDEGIGVVDSSDFSVEKIMELLGLKTERPQTDRH